MLSVFRKGLYLFQKLRIRHVVKIQTKLLTYVLPVKNKGNIHPTGNHPDISVFCRCRLLDVVVIPVKKSGHLRNII